ncbi:ATP-dependent endonuclease [Salinibacterium sp. NK8237]|uniref:ATP-dependent nuclease n=1 Tax=Salinibacterium sp. NK8237 TaxID=2792038 RepID=UPI0018CD812B|nr:ATP-binding protein [Salinibacterium sp. NK8237]MBH0129563.1 AAA family ATPase [Salinibacterium sp. NK8237]
MRLRKLEVQNFRGIQSLNWLVPQDSNLVCLVGNGDSGKSTILDAIHLVLGDRWNPTLNDTDFFASDASTPIVIKAVVSDLPRGLLKESAFGLHLSGIDGAGTVTQDPVDGTDPCLIVQLRVDDSLEPVWTIERLDDEGESAELRAYHRREFATFKVDDRVDSHLRWTRTSALGRLSSSDGEAKSALAAAARAARESIATLKDADLSDLTKNIQAKVNEVGSGTFTDIMPGLDASMSSGGNLALFEGAVPLTNYGLGTKRLAGIAIQQLAAGARTVLLIDEIEHGLEPHRVVRLIQHLRGDSSYSQIFMTTHSSVVVEQASTPNLAIVRNLDGATRVLALPASGGTALRLRRQRPSSFLAKRVLVVEGKTEEGLVKGLLECWDRDRVLEGLSVSAGEGVVVQDGQGGSEAAPRAAALHALGFHSGAFLDNDDRNVDAAVAKALAAGVQIIRWPRGKNTELSLIESLNGCALSSLLQLAVSIRGAEQAILDDLHRCHLPEIYRSIDIEEWLLAGEINLPGARELVADAAVRFSWFKSVDSGRALGEWIYQHNFASPGSRFGDVLLEVRDFAYGPNAEILSGRDV